MLAPLAFGVYLPWTLARARREIGTGAEAAYLRAHGRHHRRTDDELAGGDRRPSQLGLPAYVVARRGIHGVRVYAHRVYGGNSGGVALAATLCRKTNASLEGGPIDAF